MGFFSRFFSRNSEEKRDVSTRFNESKLTGIPGHKNVSVVANEYQAEKISAVYRCVEILSSGVACLPFRKKRLNRAEGYYVDVDSSNDLTNYILDIRANEYLTGHELLKNAVAQMLLQGNAYIVPRYDDYGHLSQLILCSPHTVSHSVNSCLYTVNDPYNGINGETFMPDNIIHLKNMSLDGGHTGISTVQYASTVLGIQATADSQTSTLIAQGGRLKGLIGNDQIGLRGIGEYSDSELINYAKEVQKNYAAGYDLIAVPGSVSFTPISMTAVDMQLLDHKKFGVQEICRFFGVHPDKVFAGQSTNYKASEMAQISFITDTLNPIIKKIEAEFRAKLVPAALADDYKFVFDLSPLFTTDLTTEAAYMEKTIATGVMTINEWRKRKDLKPVQNGDTTFISCNVAPIEQRANIQQP